MVNTTSKIQRTELSLIEFLKDGLWYKIQYILDLIKVHNLYSTHYLIRNFQIKYNTKYFISLRSSLCIC
jgi:hypothetical protein